VHTGAVLNRTLTLTFVLLLAGTAGAQCSGISGLYVRSFVSAPDCDGELDAADSPTTAIPAASFSPSTALPPAPALLAASATSIRIEPSARELSVWRALVGVQHGAAFFDAWSTRQSIASGNGVERNPLLKPFAGSSAIYAATQISPTALDLLSRRMMRSANPVLRRTWWLPQTIATVGSILCGVRNIHVAQQR
jgi:hypothetical protein